MKKIKNLIGVLLFILVVMIAATNCSYAKGKFVALDFVQSQSGIGRFLKIKHPFNYPPVLINDTELLNLGGWSTTKNILSLPYIYNLERQNICNINDKMIYKRDLYSASKINEDEILIIGRCNYNQSNICPAEIYKIQTQTFEEVGSPNFKHYYPDIIKMNNGNIFIISGSCAEIYNPKTKQFSIAGMLKETTNSSGNNLKYNTFYDYASSKAVKLNNGQILITGSMSLFELRQRKKEDKNAEIYDPIKNIFMPTGQLTYSRVGHTMNLLNDGKVLVTGGMTKNGCNLAEIYDPKTQKFRKINNMKYGRYNHGAITLNNGNVLLVGGIYGQDSWMKYIRIAEIYDYKTGQFRKAGLTVKRPYYSRLELLGKNKVIISGNGVVEVYKY